MRSRGDRGAFEAGPERLAATVAEQVRTVPETNCSYADELLRQHPPSTRLVESIVERAAAVADNVAVRYQLISTIAEFEQKLRARGRQVPPRSGELKHDELHVAAYGQDASNQPYIWVNTDHGTRMEPNKFIHEMGHFLTRPSILQEQTSKSEQAVPEMLVEITACLVS